MIFFTTLVFSFSGSPGVALYPVYCLINHACFNNTNYVKFPDLRLELRAQLPIRKGEEVFTRYISSTIGERDTRFIFLIQGWQQT